jgi:hypothetical protein
MSHRYLSGTPIRGAGQVIDVHKISKAAESQIARQAAEDVRKAMGHNDMKSGKAEMLEARPHPSFVGRHEQGYMGRQIHRASFLPPVDLPAHLPGSHANEVPIAVVPNPTPMKHKVAPVEAHATGIAAPKTKSCYGMFSPIMTPPRGSVPLAYIG